MSQIRIWAPWGGHLPGEGVPGVTWKQCKDTGGGGIVFSSIGSEPPYPPPHPTPHVVFWCSVAYRSALIDCCCCGEIHQAFTLYMTHLPVAGAALSFQE